jgi:uncharacterized protein (TIGR04255 family)
MGVRRYRHDPLREVMCEFRLAPEVPWDPTIPGLIYEGLREEFPEKRERLAQEIQITQTPHGFQQEIRSAEMAVFSQPDGLTIVQVAPRLLTVNRLRPYQGWDHFRPCIARAFQALRAAVSVHTLETLTLRYINQVEIADGAVDLKSYFEIRPFLGDHLPQDLAGFMLGCVLASPDSTDSCRIHFASLEADQPDVRKFLLMLEHFPTRPRSVAVESALSWIDHAHEQIVQIFEGCITDQLRQLLGEEV